MTECLWRYTTYDGVQVTVYRYPNGMGKFYAFDEKNGRTFETEMFVDYSLARNDWMDLLTDLLAGSVPWDNYD